MKLIKDEIYSVSEFCGMFELKGKFIGYKGSDYNMSSLLIFENMTERLRTWKFFGAKWTFGGKITDPNLYLRSTHYGNSPHTLKYAAGNETVTLL